MMAQKKFALGAPFIVILATTGCSAGGSASEEPVFGSGTGSGPGQGGQTGTGGSNPFGGQSGEGGLGFSGGFGTSGSFSGNPDGGGCRSLSQRPELGRQPADIIWIIDNSGSMQNEAAAVQTNMNAFSQLITASGIDHRVVLISDPNVNTFCFGTFGIQVPPPLGGSPNFLHVTQEVGSNNPLEITLNTYSQWQSIMRPNATKTFIVVTDDQSDMPAQTFTDGVNALDPMFASSNWKFSGIFCNTPSCSAPGFVCLGLPLPIPACAAQGTVYAELVNARGGTAADLCAQNFDPVFKSLADQIISSSGIECEFDIPPAPPGQTLDPNKVNVTWTNLTDVVTDIYGVADQAGCDPTLGGWYYDDNAAPTHISICPQTCTALNSGAVKGLDVQFGCERKLIPIH
jgi:hypothetical protein